GPSKRPPPRGMPESGQTGTPSRQAVVPGRHSPTQLPVRPPGQLSPQGKPTSVGLSSATKLQSSSMPLQVSGGKTQGLPAAMQSPACDEAMGQWYSQPVTLMSPLAGLWRKVVTVGSLMHCTTWHTPVAQLVTAPGRLASQSLPQEPQLWM